MKKTSLFAFLSILVLAAAVPSQAHVINVEWIKEHGMHFSAMGSLVFQYIRLGLEHILIGYDHILFLLSLVLLGTTLGVNIRIITSFTIAHSITLACASLNLINIPSRIVEPAIAASIIYVAVENFFVKDIRGRWKITFLFGLIHGFGFASVLREIGFPGNTIWAALVSFNVGVEIGQLFIILLIFLFLNRFQGNPNYRKAAFAGSGAIALMASWWLVQRTFNI